jgi:ABC-type uncharacterized transport system permease subunit
MSRETNSANSSANYCCADTTIKRLSLQLINTLELLEVLERSLAYANMTNDGYKLNGEEALVEQIYHALSKVHDDLDKLH